MITLPNGDKWIIDDRELDEWEEGEGHDPCRGLKEVPIRDFLEELLDDELLYVPRKLTKKYGGYWDCNFDPYQEILGAIAVKAMQTKFFRTYEMPWGEVIVVYTSFEMCAAAALARTEVARFADKEAYMKAVTI